MELPGSAGLKATLLECFVSLTNTEEWVDKPKKRPECNRGANKTTYDRDLQRRRRHTRSFGF